jgi:hypothetical protein
MTMTTPWRRITLQYSQRGFTDARTFICSLLIRLGDPVAMPNALEKLLNPRLRGK